MRAQSDPPRGPLGPGETPSNKLGEALGWKPASVQRGSHQASNADAMPAQSKPPPYQSPPPYRPPPLVPQHVQSILKFSAAVIVLMVCGLIFKGVYDCLSPAQRESAVGWLKWVAIALTRKGLRR